MNIKELIKDNYVEFDSYRQGFFYYNVLVQVKQTYGDPGPERYQFSVPLDDIGTATLLNRDRAIIYMRWIRKAIENETLIKL
jgi:hypothetical protein